MRASAIIESILRDYPETRNSDKELYIKVWEQYGFRMTASQQNMFRHLPSSETIRRVRQKLQENGSYEAAERVRRHRKFSALRVQQVIPKTKPEKVESLLEIIETNNWPSKGQTNLL